MADPQPEILNVVALAIIILPFLTTEALDRIDKLDDEGWQGYVKVGTLFALFLSFLITVLVATLVLNIAAVVIGGVDITAAYFLFVALYLPTLGLLIPAVVETIDLIFHSDLNRTVVAIVLILEGLVAGLLITANPVS